MRTTSYNTTLLGREGRAGDWISTFTGGRWWPHDPRREDVRLADLRALAQVVRFGGHCRLPDLSFALYVVMQHSVHVCEVVADLGGSREERRCGLLHDGHEVYPPGDVLSPVFSVDNEVTRALRALQGPAKRAFREAAGLPYEMPEVVKRADVLMLATEKRDLLAPVAWDKPLPEPLPWRLEVWTPEMCWNQFRRHARDLGVTL